MITENYTLIVAAILFSLLVLFIIYLFRNTIRKNPFFIKIMSLVSGLIDGLLSFRKIKRKTSFFASTFFIWLCYWGMLQIAVLSYPESTDFGFVETFTLLIVGGMAMSAPAPGGIGPYHYLVGNLLMIYGMTNKNGIILATILHSSQMLMMIIVGTISLIFVLLLNQICKK